MVFWVIIGALMGFAAARIKSFNVVGGIISGILLGPLALLMFLCSEGRKKCPFCANKIKKQVRICPHCKKALDMIEFECPTCNTLFSVPIKHKGKLVECPNCKTPVEIPKKLPYRKKRKNCPFCAEQINVDVRVCPFCNQDLVTNEFACPACHIQLQAPKELEGKLVECPNCKESIKIPDKTLSRKSRINNKKVFVGVCLIIILLAICLIGYLMRDKSLPWSIGARKTLQEQNDEAPEQNSKTATNESNEIPSVSLFAKSTITTRKGIQLKENWLGVSGAECYQYSEDYRYGRGFKHKLSLIFVKNPDSTCNIYLVYSIDKELQDTKLRIGFPNLKIYTPRYLNTITMQDTTYGRDDIKPVHYLYEISPEKYFQYFYFTSSDLPPQYFFFGDKDSSTRSTILFNNSMLNNFANMIAFINDSLEETAALTSYLQAMKTVHEAPLYKTITVKCYLTTKDGSQAIPSCTWGLLKCSEDVEAIFNRLSTSLQEYNAANKEYEIANEASEAAAEEADSEYTRVFGDRGALLAKAVAAGNNSLAAISRAKDAAEKSNTALDHYNRALRVVASIGMTVDSGSFENGVLTLDNVKVGEYTLCAKAKYGSQSMLWCKHIRIMRQNVEIRLTNDGSGVLFDE